MLKRTNADLGGRLRLRKRARLSKDCKIIPTIPKELLVIIYSYCSPCNFAYCPRRVSISDWHRMDVDYVLAPNGVPIRFCSAFCVFLSHRCLLEGGGTVFQLRPLQGRHKITLPTFHVMGYVHSAALLAKMEQEKTRNRTPVVRKLF